MIKTLQDFTIDVENGEINRKYYATSQLWRKIFKNIQKYAPCSVNNYKRILNRETDRSRVQNKMLRNVTT
jgi:hypothetical protein